MHGGHGQGSVSAIAIPGRGQALLALCWHRF